MEDLYNELDKKRKRKKRLMVLIICILLLPVFLLIATPLYNNIVSYTFSKQLFEAELPPHSQLTETYNLCGNLISNGDNIDFVAVILIKSEESISTIEQHYKNITFERAKKVQIKTTLYPEIKILEREDPSMHFHNYNLYFEEFKESASIDDKYYIIILNDCYAAGWDLRGYN